MISSSESGLKIQSHGFLIDQFQGLWHVTHSTLNMWRKGEKYNPRIEYNPLPPEAATGAERWSDLVMYDEPGPKQIKGIDMALEKGGRKFRWRGSGWLFWVKCDCEVSVKHSDLVRSLGPLIQGCLDTKLP